MNLKKKIITSLGIAFMAMAMFFGTNSIKDINSNMSLANLTSMNVANAEAGGGECDKCVVKKFGSVKFSCKTVQGEKCKKTDEGSGASVECNNAKQC